jgi:hypothetical protein
MIILSNAFSRFLEFYFFIIYLARYISIMDLSGLKKSVLSTVSSAAGKNRALLDKAADFVPQARAAKLAVKIAIAIVAVVCIILVIISVVLFTQNHPTAGIWVLGAAIALGGFSVWFHFYRWNTVGAADQGDEFEILDNVYEEYSPQDYDFV